MDVDDEPEDPSVGIIQPFDPDRIKINTTPAVIDGIIKRIDFNEIDLAPEFQRKARLWSKENKSRLIESLLLKIPLPVFYVAADSKDCWAVVDGIQRLTTIYDFVKDKFPLNGLEYLTQLEGQVFKKLPRSFQRRIEETALGINVIQDGTPEEVMINIFKRINTGGLPLTAQEIRNALNKGPVRSLLQDLAKANEFIVATTGSIKDDRMLAQETVLRFLAFYNGTWREYVKQNYGLDQFLNSAMRNINEMSKQKLDHLSDVFRNTMQVASELLGDNAFRKPKNVDGTRNRFNKALFETWSVNLAKCTQAQQQNLIKNKKKISTDFGALMRNPEFISSISSSTGAPARVETRFVKIEKLIQDTLK